MKNTILTVGTMILLTLFAPTTYACFCAVPDLPKAYERAGAVFIGEVVEIVPPVASEDKSSLPNTLYTINFKVEKSWKGISSSKISVLSGNGNGECLSYPAVRVGEKYLVYGDALPKEVSSKSQIVITTCNRTALIPAKAKRTRLPSTRLEFDRRNASPDLKALEKLRFMTGSSVFN